MKIRILWLYLFAASLGDAVFAADSVGKLRVLVVTGGHGFQRDPFFQMFADNPAITFTEAKQIKTSEAYDCDDLPGFNVVVLYDMVQTITDTQKAKFLSLFDKGTGLVVLHHALVSYPHWPDFERIIGGRYPEADRKSGVVTPEVGYEHDVDIPVVIVARDHPVIAGLNNFMIHDEIYWGFRVGPDITPLLTTTLAKSGKPLAWARTEKKSRVVFIQLGHGPEAFEDSNYRRLVAQSINWAANKSDGGAWIVRLRFASTRPRRSRRRENLRYKHRACRTLKRYGAGSARSYAREPPKVFGQIRVADATWNCPIGFVVPMRFKKNGGSP